MQDAAAAPAAAHATATWPPLLQGEISRLAKILGNNDSAVYLGGMSSHFTHIPGSPIPIVDTLAKQQGALV